MLSVSLSRVTITAKLTRAFRGEPSADFAKFIGIGGGHSYSYRTNYFKMNNYREHAVFHFGVHLQYLGIEPSLFRPFFLLANCLRPFE